VRNPADVLRDLRKKRNVNFLGINGKDVYVKSGLKGKVFYYPVDGVINFWLELLAQDILLKMKFGNIRKIMGRESWMLLQNWKK